MAHGENTLDVSSALSGPESPSLGISARIRGSPRIMARLDMTVENILDKRFRAAVYKKYGMKKGSIKTAVEEAILLWLKEGKK